MKIDFTKNTKRGIAAGVVSQLIGLIFPFLNRTLFLWLLGPKYLGLNGLFTSILGVLMLAEFGFGTAVVCSLYKPIADDDRELICAYIRFYRKIYRWVGAMIFVGGLCLMPFLRELIHGNLPPDINLHILYLLHLLNTSASYFLFAYRGAIIGAHQRHDVLTNIRTFVKVAQYLAVFLVLVLTRNYYFYVVTMVIFTVVLNLLIMRESRRLFPDIEPSGELSPERRKKVFSDVKSIFLHKIGAVASNSIDNILLAALIGLDAVAAYGNYYYVCTTVAGIPMVIYYSMTGGFGNKIHTESRERNFELFLKVYRLVGVVIIWCAAIMLALYQPFIKLWMGHKYSTLALHFLTPALMVLYFYINQSRQVLLTFKSAAGLWREDRWKPVAGAMVKLTLSLFFILTLPPNFKLDGLILATIIGYAFVQMPWESHVVFTAFFDRKQAGCYWKNQLCFALTALVFALVALTVVRLIPLQGCKGLVIQGIAAVSIVSIMVLLRFRKDVQDLLATLRRKS